MLRSRPMESPDPAEFTDLLDRLAGGARPLDDDLEMLSDLTREQAVELRDVWGEIPDETRAATVAGAARLSAESIDVEYSRFARIVLADELSPLRLAAVALLREASDRTTARALVDVVGGDPADDVVTAAARVLGDFVLRRELGTFDKREGDAVVDALRGVAGDRDRSPLVRGAVIESLAARDLPWVPPLILETYYDDDSALRLAAVRAMGRTANDRWLEYLYEQMESGDPDFRIDAAAACGEIASEEAIDRVADLYTDEDPEVVRAAISATGEIGGEVAVEYLNELAEDAPGELQLVIADAARGRSRDDREREPCAVSPRPRSRLPVRDAVSAGGRRLAPVPRRWHRSCRRASAP